MKNTKRILLFLILILTVQITFAQLKSDKPTFVLVHGAWHGGWSWQDVSRDLREKGCLVYTPTLSGMGEYKHTINDSINLITHITDIINLIEIEDLDNVILVGHSYSGLVIAGVADSISERLNKLVFLDAMILKNGESALSIQTQETQDYMNNFVISKHNVPAPSAKGFGIKNTAKIKWVNERLTLQPYHTFTQKLLLKHTFGNSVPLNYIACNNPALPVLEIIHKNIQNDPEWSFYTLNTGHDAMLTLPYELSELLLDIAQ